MPRFRDCTGVEEGEEASARAGKFDMKKKLPIRVPHFPTKPVDQGPKGPTFITVVWELAKEDIDEPRLPLPMEHQVQYGARRKGKWCERCLIWCCDHLVYPSILCRLMHCPFCTVWVLTNKDGHAVEWRYRGI